MSSLILRTATRALVPLLLLLSIFLLLRGHNEPGGGFIAGLVAAAAFVFYAIAVDVRSARALLRVDPRVVIAAGLLLAGLSGVVGFLAGLPYLTGRWSAIYLPAIGEVKVGTVLLFDGGVYLVVIGVVLLVTLTLAEE